MTDPENPSLINAQELFISTHASEAALELAGNHLESITELTPDLGPSLIKFSEKGLSLRLAHLASIVFGSEIDTSEDPEKPFKWKVQIGGEQMNARMVGQTLRAIMTYKQANILIEQALSGYPKELQTSPRAEALDQVRDHFNTVMTKHRLSETPIGDTNLRSLFNDAGLAQAPGIDKASPEQLTKIFSTLSDRSSAITPQEKNQVSQRIQAEILPQS